MALGDRQQLVTLDTPNGASGYLPLDPATWYCQARRDVSGPVVLVGEFHPGISVHTRVTLKGHVYHVDGVVNREERDGELELTCSEVFDG